MVSGLEDIALNGYLYLLTPDKLDFSVNSTAWEFERVKISELLFNFGAEFNIGDGSIK
jgi:hypothetical protein